MSNMLSPLVSVIIPIYNAAPFLDQALDSVQSQTHRNLEIICLNDGSTDNSLEIMRAHAAEDSRIVVIDKQNQGYGATCNHGLDEAHGEWIAILEPDDWIEPGMYHDMLAFAASFKERIDLIKTPYWSIINPDTPHEVKIACRYKGRVKPHRQPFSLEDATRLIRHRPSIWSALYRLNYLKEKGVRFVEAPGAGWTDNPFLYETLCQTNRIAYLDKPYYCYREESNEKKTSFARNSPFAIIDRWNEMTDVLDRLKITDEGILSANCKRGLNYIRLIFDAADGNNPRISEAIKHMAARMDSSIVFAESEISPANKKLYAQVTGQIEPSGGSTSYKLALIKEGLLSMKNAGIVNTLRLVKAKRAK